VDAFAWGVVGSLAGVACAVAAVAFGVIPLVQAHRSRSAEQRIEDGSREDATGRERELGPGFTKNVMVGDVPQQATAFQGRAELLAALTRETTPSGVPYVVTGLRGVGKSQLAAACARWRLAERWQVVAWIDASSRGGLLAGYAQLAAELGLTGDVLDSAVAAQRARHWLEADGERCLVVLDNADSADVVRPFLPAGGSASVIVTSSRAALASLGTAVPVDAYTQSEAVAFLADRTGLVDAAGAVEVARELGCLPLALAHAGAVIAGQRLDYPTYLQRLAAVSVRDYLARPEEDPYPHGTAHAITLVLDAACIRDTTGARALMLAVMAVLSPAGVPRSVLAAAANLDDAAADGVLGHLAGWSLVSFSVDGSAVMAHRLVLRVMREFAATTGALAAATGYAMRGLTKLLPAKADAWRHPNLIREFVTQLTALADYLDTLPDVLKDSWPEAFHSLVGLAGWYLREISDLPLSIVLLERALAASQHVLGLDHPVTLTSRSILAGAYRESGQLKIGINLSEQSLTEYQRVLGSDHPDTLVARALLACAYQAGGRLDQAVTLFERTVSESERILGSDHPSTLTVRGLLASAYHTAGRLDQATVLFEHTLADRQRILGSDHPETLTVRNNFASAHQAAGRLDQAVPLFEQTVAEYERVLGSDHPRTLTARALLAGAYQASGRLDHAIVLFEQTLADRQRILGFDHLDTMTARGLLASAYQAAGRLDQAIVLFEQTLADRQRILGSDHPDTLTARNNLAGAYQAAGRLDEAIPLLRQAFADAMRVFGAENPRTTTVDRNLAALQSQARQRRDHG
jgi:tetratricopeptide (TPR) repeat protein